MKLYVIRHGQTDWNVAGKCQGMSDIELNETGIEQAKKVKEQIKKYNIDLIISSPLKRAKKTAEIINEAINCPIEYDNRVIERGFGNIEGTTESTRSEIFGDNNIDIINNYNVNYNEQNIEPVKDVCKRVWKLLDEIKGKNQNVLIVTHGGTCRAIGAYFNGIDESGMLASAHINNCEIREYEFKK